MPATFTEIGTLITRNPALRGGRPIIAGTGTCVRTIAIENNRGLSPKKSPPSVPRSRQHSRFLRSPSRVAEPRPFALLQRRDRSPHRAPDLVQGRYDEWPPLPLELLTRSPRVQNSIYNRFKYIALSSIEFFNPPRYSPTKQPGVGLAQYRLTKATRS